MAAKTATELTLQRLHALPPTGVVPPAGDAPAFGAFAVPPEGARRLPASKSFAFNYARQTPPAEVPSFKAILQAVVTGAAACKAIGLFPSDDGGYVLPVTRSQEIIDLLYAKEVAMALGADFQTMTTQTMEVPKFIEGAQAFCLADNEEAVESQARFGQVVLNLKRLTAMTRVSRRWIRYTSGPAAERKLRDDMAKVVTLRQDLDILRGTGAVPTSQDRGAAPLGLRWTEGVTKLNAGSQPPTLELLEQMVLTLLRHNVDDDGTFGWAMHPMTLARFTNLRSANGEPLLRQNWADMPYPTLMGYRYATTTQIPINLGVSGNPTQNGNLSEIYFGRWSDMVIGVGQDVAVSTTTERYWEFDQVGIRVDVDWDAKVFRPEAFVVATNVLPLPTGEA